MSAEIHTCAKCGHRWQSAERETAAAIIKAAKVNRTGPFCALCYHLEMAARYARHRGDWPEALANRTLKELALGYLRYEAVRKMSPRTFGELHKLNLSGKFFDSLVDEALSSPPPAL